MFVPIHGTFATNYMFHLNLNYSNSLNYVIHKMECICIGYFGNTGFLEKLGASQLS